MREEELCFSSPLIMHFTHNFNRIVIDLSLISLEWSYLSDFVFFGAGTCTKNAVCWGGSQIIPRSYSGLFTFRPKFIRVPWKWIIISKSKCCSITALYSESREVILELALCRASVAIYQSRASFFDCDEYGRSDTRNKCAKVRLNEDPNWSQHKVTQPWTL
jgi:hypothetical protein